MPPAGVSIWLFTVSIATDLFFLHFQATEFCIDRSYKQVLTKESRGKLYTLHANLAPFFYILLEINSTIVMNVHLRNNS